MAAGLRKHKVEFMKTEPDETCWAHIGSPKSAFDLPESQRLY